MKNVKKNVKQTREQASVVIVGAGPAGIGMAIFLKKSGYKNVQIIEKNNIANSFINWPTETRFISPSFTSNFFGMPDLNAVTPDTSPAYNIGTEHPTGLEYAKYLENCVKHFKIKIETGIEVKSVSKIGDTFELSVSNSKNKSEKIDSKYVIWAAGEYAYANMDSFEGQDLGMHFSGIKSYKDLTGDEYVIVGGYESGMDIATHLLDQGKKVTVIDGSDPLGLVTSDSSTSLSPYTRDKIKKVYTELENKNLLKNFDYHKNVRVESVEAIEKNQQRYFQINLENGKKLISKNKPIICTGFEGSTHKLIKEEFAWNGARPLLTEKDESTISENLFLAGSHIVHDKAVFCFVYKFRQRFAIVGEEILKRESYKSDMLDQTLGEYKKSVFYLEDLSGCCQDCSC